MITTLGERRADTGTSTGCLMLAVLGGLADVERDLIRTCTGEGGERAMANGKILGRKPTLTPHQQKEARERRDVDGETLHSIARAYNVSPQTILRLKGMSVVVRWLDVLKISVSSILLTTLGSWVLNHFFVLRAALKRESRYVAQRVAIILEKFAVDCANVIIDNDTYSHSEGRAGKRHLCLPALGSLPADVDWKALPRKLLDRVLLTPNELALAEGAISFWWDVVADEGCMQTETDQRAGPCGLRAWLLASDLRKQYK